MLAGVSESVQNFAALEAVDEELGRIQDLEGGELLLNRAFTLDRIRAAVAQEIPGIVHLATHAVFTGNPDTSFLLTYDGRVGFEELSDVVGMTKAEGAPLDLLVLSACETAVGNAAETPTRILSCSAICFRYCAAAISIPYRQT